MVVTRDEKKVVQLITGAYVTPVATIRCDHLGEYHIIVDNGCYALLYKWIDDRYKMSYYWFPAAIDVLRTLPSLKISA